MHLYTHVSFHSTAADPRTPSWFILVHWCAGSIPTVWRGSWRSSPATRRSRNGENPTEQVTRTQQNQEDDIRKQKKTKWYNRNHGENMEMLSSNSHDNLELDELVYSEASIRDSFSWAEPFRPEALNPHELAYGAARPPWSISTENWDCTSEPCI